MAKNTVILYGYRTVLEALQNKTRKTFKLFITRQKLQDSIKENLIQNYPYINIKTPQELNHMCGGTNHNNIALEVEYLYTSVPLQNLKNSIILLANITDTGNLGAVIRSAGILGYDIILPKNHSAPINSIVGKNAAGGLEHVQIHMCNSLIQTVQYLKKNYYFLVGAMENNDQYLPINLHDLPDKICLVMGGEQEGIPKGVKDELDFAYTIPGNKNFNVFNVSVASALAMFNLRKEKIN